MAKSDKLARLRAARKGEKISDSEPEHEDNYNIYDEVDEHQYRKHKRDRVLNDDFIVDDNGEGYAETGADDWENNGHYENYSDYEENGGENNNASKKLKKVKMVKDTQSKPIDNFFKQPLSKIEKKQKLKTETDSSVLNDILSDFTSSVTNAKGFKNINNNSNKRKNPFAALDINKKMQSSTPLNKKVQKTPFHTSISDSLDVSSSPIKEKHSFTEEPATTTFFTAHENTESRLSTPSSPLKFNNDQNYKNINLLDELDNVPMDVEIANVKQEKADEEEEDDEVIVSRRKKTSTAKIDRSVMMVASRMTSKTSAVDSSPLKHAKHLEIDSSPSKLSNVSNISNYSNFSNVTFERLQGNDVVTKDNDDDDVIQMFWLDFIELPTSLLLFGKIKAKDGRLVSGMVQINGINRTLYFLPRSKRLEEDEDPDQMDTTTDQNSETCTPMDVHDEIIPLLMDKFGLDSIKAKAEHRKYAFEHFEIPKEAEYLKVLLPFDTPKSKGVVIPSNMTGETFSAVFGTSTSIFESFVLQRQIMGPCWLTISNCDFNALQNVSHCNVEFAVSSPMNIQPDLYIKDPPPSLNVLSINVEPYLNAKTNRQEVGLVSLALYKDLPQDVPIPADLKPTDTVTLIRPIGGTTNFPIGLKGIAEKRNVTVRLLNNEKILLNCLVGLIKKYDPDVFVGHRLENVTLDILLHRMKDLNIGQWSNMGRISKRQFPEKFNRTNGRFNLFAMREMLAGRLLCDISNEMGQSLTPKCQNWELSEMFEVVCKEKYAPIEINLANPLVAEDANKVFAIINENLKSVKVIAKTSFSMQILSISKQLTNLAGNAWSQTLGGTRAGRNEYILLHEFEREGYIVPDKETRQSRQAYQQQSGNGDDEEENSTSNNKKAKYQGGLVFEPEKGLHKNFILVMDFNSLYPSIIQEFNICFTTVERSSLSDDELPKVPTKKEMGVLPKLLQQLVNRRKEVKLLMKNPKLSEIEKAQLDIKQMALKVTANSMYGCLGYVNSRFYAKSLAMLVTNKGREILMDTRELAQSAGLNVVYGDTDSVMIDTSADSYLEAIKIGNEFKIKVNERYRLLEIDIDNVFKRLLLHAKKKYAALDCSIDSNGQEVCNLEVKGLDMKRREYCPLSKELSIFTLNELLRNSDQQDALNKIYNELTNTLNEFKDNNVPMMKLRINTKLSKDPKLYPNGKSMPSVQVALRLQEQGKIVKAGNVITYVVTTGDDPESSVENTAQSVASRSRSLNEVLSGSYKPDVRYYCEKQLFNPIDRLLTKVEGYDVVRLADSLGLEGKRYESQARTLIEQHELQPLESQISDVERFRDSKPLTLKCIHCSSQFVFGGIQSSNDYTMTFNGISCKKCSKLFHPLTISSQLEIFIRNEIDKYYECWLNCDLCGLETREVSVYGKRCIGFEGTAHECKGIMKIKYTDKQFYNQLLYLKSLFDVEKAVARKLKPISSEIENKMTSGDLKAHAENNRSKFKIYNEVISKYLGINGRNYVDLGLIFRASKTMK